MAKVICYSNKDATLWLAETVLMTASGPKTVWSWLDDIHLATPINVGILPPSIREAIVPHNVSIETNIIDLGEYEL